MSFEARDIFASSHRTTTIKRSWKHRCVSEHRATLADEMHTFFPGISEKKACSVSHITAKKKEKKESCNSFNCFLSHHAITTILSTKSTRFLRWAWCKKLPLKKNFLLWKTLQHTGSARTFILEYRNRTVMHMFRRCPSLSARSAETRTQFPARIQLKHVKICRTLNAGNY